MDQESEAERSLNLHKDTQQESSRAMAGTRQAGYRTCPLHHLRKPYWTAGLYHLFPWSDQPLQRISILHIQHSTFVAPPTLLLAHLYQPLWIKPTYQKETVLKREIIIERTSKQGDESHSPALADCELWMDLNLLHLNYAVKITIQSANHIHGFCIHRYNQLWIKNIQKKFQKVPKSKTLICCTPATIYIAFTLYFFI